MTEFTDNLNSREFGLFRRAEELQVDPSKPTIPVLIWVSERNGDFAAADSGQHRRSIYV
jgi:hypothetical protein